MSFDVTLLEMLKFGLHATLLTSGSNMDMVKMSVVDKSLKCGNYPKNNRNISLVRAF